jgi:hypothetical protein
LDDFFFEIGYFSRGIQYLGMDFPNSAQKVSEIDLNTVILFFRKKIAKREKNSPTLCPKILPLHAQERDLIPLVVYLTQKFREIT